MVLIYAKCLQHCLAQDHKPIRAFRMYAFNHTFIFQTWCLRMNLNQCVTTQFSHSALDSRSTVPTHWGNGLMPKERKSYEKTYLVSYVPKSTKGLIWGPLQTWEIYFLLTSILSNQKPTRHNFTPVWPSAQFDSDTIIFEVFISRKRRWVWLPCDY